MEIEKAAEGIIKLALAEDLGTQGDVTTRAVVKDDLRGRGSVISRQPCTVAGQSIAARVFELAGSGAVYRPRVADGDRAPSGVVLGEVEGPLAAILKGERTALNFLTHLSGIATLTRRLVDIAEPFGVQVMDTRKTTPGLRVLEKYAVAAGGGTNHRVGLFDGVIIKDNHIAAAGGVEIAVRRVQSTLGNRFPVEVEVATLAQVREALDAGADIVMLDNMDPRMVGDAVALVAGRAVVEVSGGINPDNLIEYARLGVDRISLGFLTHSAPAADMSLEVSDG